MFGHSVKLFKMFGFEIKADVSWIILAALITGSLAMGWFPEFYKDLPASYYWLMGAAGALGLFVSVIIHELTHSLVARLYSVFIRSITLFVFGGVTHMEEDPPSYAADFWMAVAGPISSAILSGVMFLMLWLGRANDWPPALTGVLAYLAWLNLVLAVFNLAPAFPLDGGRILRSILWRWKTDFQWATLVAVRVGYALGFVLTAVGSFLLITGSLLSGGWWVMVGVFVWVAARGSYRQLQARNIIHNVKVRDIMIKNPVVISRSMSLKDFFYEYVYQDYYQLYPVEAFGKFAGCVTVANASLVPKDDWTTLTVGSVTAACSPETAIAADKSAAKAMAVMQRTGHRRLLVLDEEQLAGVISLDDVLELMSLDRQEAIDDRR